MRGTPGYLARRLSRRARLTAGGIALCVAFAVLSLTVVDGLRSSTYAVSDQYLAKSALVARPGLAPFDPLDHDVREGTFVLVSQVTLDDGTPLTLAAFEARDLEPVPPGQLHPGLGLPLAEGTLLRVEAPAPALLNVSTPLRLNGSHPHWGIVAPQTLRAIDPALAGGLVTYAVVPAPTATERARLEAQGFDVSAVPAVVPFFEAGANEVVRDLSLVVAFSCVLVALLTYEFMHMETRAKRREIGIWRSLGMQRREVLRILLGQAGLLGAAGVLAGTVTALGLVFMAYRLTRLDLLLPRPNLALLGGVALAMMAATLVGASIPAWRTARATVREALEAPR